MPTIDTSDLGLLWVKSVHSGNLNPRPLCSHIRTRQRRKPPKLSVSVDFEGGVVSLGQYIRNPRYGLAAPRLGRGVWLGCCVLSPRCWRHGDGCFPLAVGGGLLGRSKATRPSTRSL